MAEQEAIVQTIQNEIIGGTIAHAYIFAGPRGVGKTTMARLLAKAVNCKKRKPDSAEPCNECSSCQAVSAGRDIDVMEIDAATHTGVDSVRENIIENIQFKPTIGKYKIFIIDEAHMLSTASFNALLKTLEEPPAHALFILATTELHDFPATVVSRCQRFTFKKIGHDALVKKLKKICAEEKVKVDKEVLERIAIKSEGGLRDAESLLGQILSLDLPTITLADTEMILPTSDISSVMAFAEHLVAHETKGAIELLAAQVESGTSMDQFAYDLLEMLRTTMLIQATGDAAQAQAIYGDTMLKKIRSLAQNMTPAQLVALIEATLKRKAEIKTAPLAQLPLELLAVTTETILNTKSNAPTVATVAVVPEKTAVTKPAIATPPLPQKMETVEPPTPAGIVESIKQAVVNITHDHAAKTTLEDVKKQWVGITDKVGVTNHSLTFIMSMCGFKEIDGNRLVVTLPYSFHKEKMDDMKNKAIIDGALEATFGEKLRIAVELVVPTPIVETSDLELSNLAVQFGGEVVS